MQVGWWSAAPFEGGTGRSARYARPSTGAVAPPSTHILFLQVRMFVLSVPSCWLIGSLLVQHHERTPSELATCWAPRSNHHHAAMRCLSGALRSSRQWQSLC